MDIWIWGFPGGTSSKESTCQWRRRKRHRFNPWVSRIPWSRIWQPTPVFSLGKFHGQRSLAGYSPWGHKESEWSELLSTHTHTYLLVIMNNAAIHKVFCGHIFSFLLEGRYSSILGRDCWIYFFFNWRINTLQNCVGFCQTSTWISHRYSYVPSLFFVFKIPLTILGHVQFLVNFKISLPFAKEKPAEILI